MGAHLNDWRTRATLLLILSTAIGLNRAAVAVTPPIPPDSELTCLMQSCMGFHIGGTLSRISGATSGSARGLHLGLEVEVPFSDWLALTEEINFTQKGGEDFVDDPGSNLTVNQLEIPIQFKLRKNLGNSLAYLKSGFSIAAIAGARLSSGTPISTADRFLFYEPAFRIGAGYSIPFPLYREINLDFCASYVLGLRSLVGSTIESAKSRTALLTIGSQFPF